MIDMIELDHALEVMNMEGLRRTPQRAAVIEALVDNREHPTAETIWATVRNGMPSISLSTVYSTLRELESLGLIQYVPDDEALRIDPDVSAHAHLSCTVCGKVFDLPDHGATNEVREVAAGQGHKVDRAAVVLQGVCATCLRAGHSQQFLES